MGEQRKDTWEQPGPCLPCHMVGSQDSCPYVQGYTELWLPFTPDLLVPCSRMG